jgi:hypothetical protein
MPFAKRLICGGDGVGLGTKLGTLEAGEVAIVMLFPWSTTIEGVKIVPSGSVLNAVVKAESIFTLLVVPTPTFILPKGIVCVPIRVGGFPFVNFNVTLWIEDGSGILFFILFVNIIFVNIIFINIIFVNIIKCVLNNITQYFLSC